MFKLNLVCSAFGLICAVSSQGGLAATINIVNGNFETPNIGLNPGAYSGFTTEALTPANVGWFDATNNSGVCSKSYVGNSDADSGTQNGYIGNSTMSQNIGVLNSAAVYTINFSAAGGPPITAKLYDATTGNVLASQTYSALTGTLVAQSPAVLVPDATMGSTGDTLWLQFSAGYQSYIDGVSGSVTPEPASMSLLCLGALGLMVRRRVG